MPPQPARRVAIALAALLCAGTVGAQTSHMVTRIVDGDTLVLEGLGTVRLIGVDTPETVDPRRPVEEFGKQSSAFLTGLTLGKTVRVEYDQTRKDRYGRTLAYLYLADGTFVNREIVRLGYGHAYTKYPFKFMEDFRAAAREAQEAKRGLWGVGLSPEDIVTLSTASTSAPLGLLSAAAVGTTAVAGAAAIASNASETVYATKTGTKYHRVGCRSLSRSQIPMTLKDASARYGACSICNPPTLATHPVATAPGAKAAPLPAKAAPAPAPRAVSRQCAATTQKGTRCSRTASAGSNYCWQHGKEH